MQYAHKVFVALKFTCVAIAKGLIGSSSSVTNSVNVSRIPSLCGRLITTVKESIILDSGFQKVTTYVQ